jgi:hypothetical protein
MSLRDMTYCCQQAYLLYKGTINASIYRLFHGDQWLTSDKMSKEPRTNHQMSSNVVKYRQTTSNVVKCRQTTSNVVKCSFNYDCSKMPSWCCHSCSCLWLTSAEEIPVTGIVQCTCISTIYTAVTGKISMTAVCISDMHTWFRHTCISTMCGCHRTVRARSQSGRLVKWLTQGYGPQWPAQAMPISLSQLLQQHVVHE